MLNKLAINPSSNRRNEGMRPEPRELPASVRE
jgi:hypothetical protein